MTAHWPTGPQADHPDPRNRVPLWTLAGPIEGTHMPRYFFDLVDDQTVFDRKGVSLPNAGEAKKFAVTFARELMEAKSKLLGERWSAWSVEVSNGKFERLFRLPFTDVAASGVALADKPKSLESEGSEE